MPKGVEKNIATDALKREGIRVDVFERLDRLTAQINNQTGAILLAEEAFASARVPQFQRRLREQPEWSDLPLLVLTDGRKTQQRIRALLGRNANVTFLARPLRGFTVVSAIQTALRGRDHQFAVRDLIEERETVLASISEAFSALDRNWRYTHVNDKVAEMAGWPKEKMIGRVIWEIFPEAVGTEFYELCQRVMEKGEPSHGEFFYKPWNRWLDTRMYPTKDGMVIFRADITERKKQEQLAHEREAKLRESQDRLRLATEAADIGTFDFFPSTGELQFSDRSRELFGIPPEVEVTYETYLAGVHPEDRHVVHETVDHVRQPGSTGRFDIEYRTIGLADGKERWVAERGRAVLNSAGEVTRFIGTMLDITDKKNAEILLQRAKNEAEEANRAKDRFLAMLSHELRTPLTPVLMTIASLRREPNLSDDLRHDLEVLQRNVELEALLIDDLLDLTRIAHGKLELHNDAVDIHGTIEHALGISAGDLIGKKIHVVERFEAREHHCWADPARLQQVFWNLVKNSAKFTPAGGRLEISTRNNESHQIVIDIADNGIGIDPKLMPRIFDAFEQGGGMITSQFGGLGLGLAICKRVVDLHHGTIEARSEGPGRGATFTVTLNAMETSLLEGPVLFLETEPSETKHVQILFVEDHEDTARVLGRILKNAGFDVSQASSLAGARSLAAGRRFDLVISDVGLPDGSGLDLMSGLRDAQGLTGIALSGFGTDEDVAASPAAGFAAHLTKPVDWERLRARSSGLCPRKTPPRAVRRRTSAIAAEQHFLQRAVRIRVDIGGHDLRRRVIGVAGDAFARDLPFRAVARHAIRFRRHQDFGGLAALARVMALIAFHARMLRMIEVRLRHPAVDQNRFRHDRRAARRLDVMTESAAGEIRTHGGGRLALRLVGIGGEKDGPLQFFTGPKLFLELPDLLHDETLDVAVARPAFLQARVIAVLRGQRAQKCADQRRVAVRNSQVRIFHVELEGVAGLAVRGEIYSLIESAARIRFVAVIAIELLPVHRRNVRREMALVIEPEHIGIARLLAHELEFRMLAVEGSEHLRVTTLRSRHFKNDLLRRMRTQMKHGGRQGRPFLRRRFHHAAVVVTGSALQIGHPLHRARPEMFLMADRAGPVFDHVRLVQIVFFLRPERRVLLVALFALVIDRVEIDPVMKPVFDDALEFRQRELVAHRRVLVMALGAILLELRVMAGNSS